MRLIDADALVSKCGDYYVEEGPEDGYIGTLKTLVDMQQTVEAYGWEPMDPDKLMAWMMLPNAAKMEWISVNDRLPKEKENWITRDWQDVICCCDFGGEPRRIDVRTYSFGKGHFWHGPQIMDGVVTHWMQLPEPPVDDEMEGKRDAEKRTHD